MRNELDHLPQTKQQELAHVVRVLFEAFEAAQTRRSQKWNKQARILKLVLYGSYARGGWVDDAVSGYTSDYDILIVVNDEHLVDFEYWSAAEDLLMRDMTIAGTLSAPGRADRGSSNEREGRSAREESCVRAGVSLVRCSLHSEGGTAEVGERRRSLHHPTRKAQRPHLQTAPRIGGGACSGGLHVATRDPSSRRRLPDAGHQPLLYPYF